MTPVAFALSSSAFADGAAIPAKYTCDGVDVSPPLAWTGAPEGTRTFALIVDDPDAPAGTWVHWVLYNLSGVVHALPESVAKAESVLAGAMQGRNDFKRVGYGGPCPPPGKPHRYRFTLYALDGPLALDAGVTKADVERALRGHVMAQAQLTGRYGRRQ